MYDFADAMAHLDLIDPIEGFLSGFINADWKGAFKRRGRLGIAGELVASATQSNSPVIAFKRHSGWSGGEVEKLLKRHGVVIYDRGFTNDALVFRVKARQSRWATYLLMRKGVPVMQGHWQPVDPQWQSQPRTAEPAVPARYRGLHSSSRRNWLWVLAMIGTGIVIVARAFWP